MGWSNTRLSTRLTPLLGIVAVGFAGFALFAAGTPLRYGPPDTPLAGRAAGAAVMATIALLIGWRAAYGSVQCIAAMKASK